MKCKKVYEKAIEGLDLEDAYCSVYDLAIFMGDFDLFVALVHATAKQAVKAVVKLGLNEYTVDNFPVRAKAWYDSGDTYCEIIIYIQQATGSNKKPLTTSYTGDPEANTRVYQ